MGAQYISFCDNVIALEARVAFDINLGVTGTTSATIVYNTVTVGAYTNLDEGMTVIVSPNSDIRNPLAVRLHITYKVADATSLYVSEFSDPISAGAYIFVLYHYDIIDNLSRPLSSGGVITQYKQYDQPFQRMAPVICGAQSGYANWVDGAGHYTIAFDFSSTFAPESGATISSYLTTIKATGSGTPTVTAGSLSTSAFTIQFTYGEYWVRVTATDSNGVVYFRHILIKAHDRTNYLPSVNFDGAEITRDIQQGPSARIKAFGSVSSLLNGTICIMWVDEQYCDPTFTNSAGSLINNIDLIGWVETEQNQYVTDPKYSGYAECSFEVQGIGARLMRLEGQMLDISYNSSPTLWDQINNLTPWRAIIHFLQRHSTALQLADFALANMTADNTFLFPTIVTNAGRALDNVSGEQGIAYEINAQVEFASDGRIQLARMEPWVATDLGHTPLIIATWDNRDHCGIQSWKFSHYQQYGYSDADGAAWAGTVNVPVMPARNRAPGLAQGSGPDQGKLNNQILASTGSQLVAQAELAQRNGTKLSMLNNTTEIVLNHPSQFHWLQPSYAQVYVLSFDTTSNIRGLTLDAGTNWMVKQVTIRHDNKSGSREVSATYIPVKTGQPGANIPIINQGEIAPSLPAIPSMAAFPGLEIPLVPEVGWTPAQVYPSALLPPVGTITKMDGNSLLVATATKVYWIESFIDLTYPKWHDITPTDLGSFQVKAVAVSPYLTSSAVPAWVLASDGTNSAIWYTPNAAAGVVTWTKGGVLTGVYTVLRATVGGIIAYSPNYGGATTQTISDPLTSALGPNTGLVDATHLFSAWGATVSAAGSYSTSGGRTGGGSILGQDVGFFSGNEKSEANCYIDLGATVTVTSASFWYKHGANGRPRTAQFRFFDASKALITTSMYVSDLNSSTTYQQAIFAGSQAGVRYMDFSAEQNFSDGVPNVDDISVTFSGATTPALAAYSIDNGTTWLVQSFSTTPGAVGGMDCQSAGSVSYAAVAGAVWKSSTLGGSFSSWYSIPSSANAVAIITPWYKRNSTTKNTTTSTPDCIIACDNGKWYWIDGATATATDITPVASLIPSNPDCLTVRYGNEIAAWGTLSGQQKVYTSVDGGGSFTFRSNISSAGKIRCRRRDARLSPDGQIYLCQNNVIDYSSKWFSNALYPRYMPSNGVLMFDSVY